jgi:hypothetical protein
MPRPNCMVPSDSELTNISAVAQLSVFHRCRVYAARYWRVRVRSPELVRPAIMDAGGVRSSWFPFTQ